MTGQTTAVWLRREGGEDDPNAAVTVEVKVDGEWHELIRESLYSNFSHCAGVGALRERSIYSGVTDQNSAEKEMAITLGDGAA